MKEITEQEVRDAVSKHLPNDHASFYNHLTDEITKDVMKLLKPQEQHEPKKPIVLQLRDTGLHDDGNGRRIWTTAGSGYERIAFVELTDEVKKALRKGGVEV